MKIFEQLLELVTSFTLKRAFSLILILLIAFGAGWIVDSYVGYSRLNRLERTTSLIERIDALQQRGNSSKAVSGLTDAIAADLGEIMAKDQSPNYQAVALKEALAERWLKIICGGLPWFLMSLFGLPSKRNNDKNAWTGFLAAQSLTLAFAAVNFAIPSFQRWWIDLVLIPVGVTMVVGIIPMSLIAASAYKKVRESSLQKAILNQLRMLSAAMDQFRLENGRDPTGLSEIVGPDKYVKSLLTVDGEQYDSIDMRMGKPLVVFRKSGEVVTYS